MVSKAHHKDIWLFAAAQDTLFKEDKFPF